MSVVNKLRWFHKLYNRVLRLRCDLFGHEWRAVNDRSKMKFCLYCGVINYKGKVIK